MSDDLDTAIAKEERRSQRLRADLARSQARLKILLEARRIARGENDSTRGKKSIPDHVEEILRERGGVTHMDDIVTALRQRGISAAKETVTTSIWRYVHQKRRFRSMGGNKFALRG